ncbi:MAG: MoaD/ThiS family protein, partial [Thermoplasmata archaeon]|nr:MoaD/ThiS family protein [Thermoplasmata archaeon]
MKVIVRYFAIYREAAGESRVEMELDNGSTLGDLLEEIFEVHPKLEKWSASIVCSVNKKYANDDRVLVEGDEIALLPPVSGGARLSGEDFRME